MLKIENHQASNDAHIVTEYVESQLLKSVSYDMTL